MLEEKQRVNEPKLKIIIIILKHSRDFSSMLSHHKPVFIFIISYIRRSKERDTKRQRGEQGIEKKRLSLYISFSLDHAMSLSMSTSQNCSIMH